MKKVSQYYMKIMLLIFISTFLICCNPTNDENLEIENQKLIDEYKSVTKKFILENTYKLKDNQMFYSLDSIDRLYMVDKNKKLAEKFIETEKGLKRLNFLKKYYETAEISYIIDKLPLKQKSNKDFIEIKNYVNK